MNIAKGTLGVAACVITLVASVVATKVLAQDFPKGPVRLIVPFTAGGPTDTIARLVSIKLHEMWSHPVLIEYKPGAGTVIGVDHVAKSSPDGHTIGVVVSSYSINPVVGSTPEEFDAFVADDMKKWAKVIKDAGIPLE